MLQGHVAGACSILLPIRTPRFICAKLLSDKSAPSMSDAWGSSSPNAGFCIPFVELDEHPVSPFFRAVKLPLNGSTTLVFKVDRVIVYIGLKDFCPCHNCILIGKPRISTSEKEKCGTDLWCPLMLLPRDLPNYLLWSKDYIL